MKSLWKWLSAAVLVLLLTAVTAAACGEAARKYTVMLYVCGADLERDHGQESASMADILSTRYNTEEINVIGLLGGTPRWAGNRFDPGVLSIVSVSGRRPAPVDEMPLGAMSDPATLTSFLSYCKEHYPAEHYILVISDHGGGPLLGCCVDYLFDRSMLSVNALRTALADSPFADRGLDTIAFDCCLMGSLEISNSISPYAKYMVATEDAMFGLGHAWLSGLENDASPLETAKRIADSTYVDNKEAIRKKNATQLNSVSVIDLEKIPEVVSAINRYFTTSPQISQDSFSTIANQRRDAVSFGVTESGGNSQYDLVDVGSLLTAFGGETAENAAVQEALLAAIPFHEADVENCAGLTVYHPFANKKTAEKSMELYAGLGFAQAYVEYVINYTSIMTGKSLANWADLLTGTPEPQRDNRTLFTLTLNEEQAAHFSDARMKILWEDGNGGYFFTYVKNKTGFEQGKVTGEFNGTALFAVDAKGEPCTEAIPYSVAQNGTVLIPAELTLPGEEGQEPAVHQALIYCELDSKTKDVTPGGVAVWDEAMECWTGSFNTSFTDYSDVLLRQISRKETRDPESGALLPFDEWEKNGEKSWSLQIGGDWQFRMLDVTANAEQLYASFEVQDSQGNLYASGLHQIRQKTPVAEEVIVEYDDKEHLLIESLEVTAPVQQLVIRGYLTNLAETESFIELNHLKINGKAFDGQTTLISGTGDNWGLLQGETQPMSLMIPLELLAGEKEITSLEFDLTVRDAANEETVLAEIPVKVTLLLELP